MSLAHWQVVAHRRRALPLCPVVGFRCWLVCLCWFLCLCWCLCLCWFLRCVGCRLSICECEH
jgi:hypothetical protein